jgi:hypothetical protein
MKIKSNMLWAILMAIAAMMIAVPIVAVTGRPDPNPDGVHRSLLRPETSAAANLAKWVVDPDRLAAVVVLGSPTPPAAEQSAPLLAKFDTSGLNPRRSYRVALIVAYQCRSMVDIPGGPGFTLARLQRVRLHNEQGGVRELDAIDLHGTHAYGYDYAAVDAGVYRGEELASAFASFEAVMLTDAGVMVRVRVGLRVE